MAVDHALLGNEYGKFVRLYKILDLIASGGASVTIDGMDQMLTEIEAMFDSDATAKEFLPQVVGLVNALKQSSETIKAQVTMVFHDWLFQRVRPEIDSTALEPKGIIGDWGLRMREDSKEFLSNGTAIGATTDGTANTGDCTIVTSALGPYSYENESIQDEDFVVYCQRDSYADGLTEFQELFNIQGTYFGQTSIAGCMVPSADSTYGNRVQNESGKAPAAGGNADTTIPFENFSSTANLPDGWSKTTGTLGTDINEYSTAAGVLFGSKSLEFEGDGATLLHISQNAYDFFDATAAGTTVAEQSLMPNEKYLIGFYLKAESGITAGVVEIYLDGTVYSAGATEKGVKDMSGTPPTAAFTFYSGVVQMPKAIDDDMTINIKCTTAISSGHSVWIDGVVLARLKTLPKNNLLINVVPGGTASVAGTAPDYYRFSTTNTEAGLLQSFMVKGTDPTKPLPQVWPDLFLTMPHAGSADADYAETKAQ